MTAILRRLPFSDRPGAVSARGTTLQIKAHQIIVWVSLSAADVLTLEPSCPRFPVILDTGNTQRFSLRESQLRRWAGIDPRLLFRVGRTRHGGRVFALHAARLWLHRNQP